MGFFSKIGHALSGAAKTIEGGAEQFIRHPLEGPKDILEGANEMFHGNFKAGLGEVFHGIKRSVDPLHTVGAAHQAARPVTNPVNKALADTIKGVTGHNVLGSHPLNTVGTVVASVFTAGAAGAAMAGAGFAGSMAAGASSLASAGSTALGAVGSGLTNVGLSSLGSAVSGAGASLGAEATSLMAASGTIAGQMGLTGSQAVEMNIGSALTKAGAGGSGFFSNIATAAGEHMTGAVSEELAAGTGHAMGSFGFAETAKGGSTFVQGTAQEVAKAGVKFGSEGGFFSSKTADNINKGLKVVKAVQGMSQQQQQDMNSGFATPMSFGGTVKLANFNGSGSNGNLNNTSFLNQSDIQAPVYDFNAAASQFA